MSSFFNIIFSESFPYIVALLPIIGWILYRYFTSTFDYWKKENVPYLKPLIFFGNIKDRMLFKVSFHEFQIELYKKLDGHPFAGIFEGRRPKLLLRDPEIIRQVLIRDFDHFTDRPTLKIQHQDPYFAELLLNLKGKKWKMVRALMTPAFTSGKMKAMVQMVDKVAFQLLKYLEKLDIPQVNTTSKYFGDSKEETKETKNDPCINEDINIKEMEMKELFGRYTFDVIASCAFGVQCDSLMKPDAEFVRVVSRFDYISTYMRLLIFLVIMGNRWLLRFVTLNFLNVEAITFLVSFLKKSKKEREEGKQDIRNDFLQMMIDAKSGGNSGVIVSGNEKQTDIDDNDLSIQKVLTENVIISQCLLFLLAGYETSSTLLTFASYELAINPDIQEKTRKEVLDVLACHENITYEALNEMTYLEMVLLESLRKHPPVARIDRECVKDYTLTIPPLGGEKEKHVVIRKGIPVSISVMGLHYDPKYFPEPYQFRPERFSTEEKTKRSPYVFQGFGHGPRNCLGMRFALMSTKLVMAHLLRDYKLTTSPKTEVPYEYDKKSMLLKSKNGIWLNVIKVYKS